MAEFSRVNTIRALANALGLSVARAHALQREPWFPARGPDGWDVDAVLRAVAAHRRGEVAAAPTAASSPPPAPPTSAALAPPPLDAVVHRDVKPGNIPAASDGRPESEVLLDGDDPVAIARAALKVAARLLEGADDAGAPRALESVKRSLEELRRCEAGYLDLQREKGLVVDLEIAKSVGARAGRRFVDALERLEVRLASQVQRWMSDPGFKALHTEGQIRAVRAWVLEQTLAARSLEAAEIEKMIAAELADR